MWGVLSIVIVITVFIIWKSYAQKGEEQIQEYKNGLNEQGLEIILADEFKYYGGYDDIGECESSFIKVFNKKIELSFFGVTSEGNFAIQRDINYSELLNAQIRTEIQIQENPSLAKVFMFGMLAFAMKGKVKENIREYVVINTSTNSIILRPEGNCMDLANNINKSKEKFNQEVV